MVHLRVAVPYRRVYELPEPSGVVGYASRTTRARPVRAVLKDVERAMMPSVMAHICCGMEATLR